LEQARREIAARPVGSMTFDQAMQAVVNGKMVTRSGWHILRALQECGNCDDPERYWPFRYQGWSISDMKLDNLQGVGSGSGDPYNPTDEDRAATDWMEYQRPEFDIWVDLHE
jgi:hypothetical protein